MLGTASFDVFCVKIGARVSAVAFLKNQKNSRVTIRGAKSRMRRTETPKPIWIKFCTFVDIADVVTYTNFGDHRWRGFWVAGGQISPSPIDFNRRPYNTLALPCECVILTGASPGQNMWGGQTWRARADNGGAEAERPAESRGRARPPVKTRRLCITRSHGSVRVL